jgi:CheY-like chemotaxis protein
MDEQRLILVVEDDEATRIFLLENLRADGFRVAGASSAGEGVRAIEVRRPSLVLLDLALEAGSGLDLLDRVRHADGLASRIDPDLPVIVLTGRVGDAQPRPPKASSDSSPPGVAHRIANDRIRRSLPSYRTRIRSWE